MPAAQVVQTFANAAHFADRVSLHRSSRSERQFLKGEMEKQLKLVSHALVRGQNLPAATDPGFNMHYRTLAKIRLGNMACAKLRFVSRSLKPCVRLTIH